jgi:5-methylthioadenosine/S-adenosylhomocysteine deaminase
MTSVKRFRLAALLAVLPALASVQSSAGHFIPTDPYIIAQTGHAGAAMSWNPLSNGRLASGVPDIPVYLQAGIRVGMGVDGEASADLVDPFENLRTGLYAIRDKYESAAILSPYDVLRLHTLGSADVLGVADRLGSLEGGKLADFLVIDPSHFGHVFDPYAPRVFVTSQPDLELVYVGGELLVERGKLLKHDLAKIQAEVDKRGGLLVQTLTNCRECLGLVALRDPNLNFAKFCWKLTPRMTS